MNLNTSTLVTSLGRALRSSRFPDFWLFLISGAIGWLAGVVVWLMSLATQTLHTYFFQLPPGDRLSSQATLASPWLAVVPIVGGALVVLTGLAFRSRINRPTVDPIEANALYGGQMSFLESLLVSIQTVISSGFGASVGLEAGYTQASSVLGSKVATALNLRRADVRTLVGAAAAGAISAAFDAPLTGAFYAFETILGVYNLSVVAPVLAAAMMASFAARVMGAIQMPLLIGTLRPITSLPEILPYLFVGLFAAFLAIGVMRLVIVCETAFKLVRCPGWARPVVGGAIVGGLALVTPHVLSSGHGALHVSLGGGDTWQLLAMLFCLKALASAVSLGSGFRGGLFFASLYLGLLFGRGMATALASVGMLGHLSAELMAVVGMASMATGIVGGPLTMSFLIMELTGDLLATGAVLAASVITSLVVRSVFGYSFSTWRLHLRGETIRGAHDVGRIRGLTVASMMRTDVKTVPAIMSISQFRTLFPLGSSQRVVALDENGVYAGLILVTDAYAPGIDEAQASVAGLVKYKDHILLPGMTAAAAAKVFEASNSEELVVLADAWSKRVLGLLTEQHLLRRYAEEMDKTQRDLMGLGQSS